MTSLNVQTRDLKGHHPIEKEHVDNSAAVREVLVKRGIRPESLPPAEDVKNVRRKLEGDDKMLRPVKKSRR